MAGERPKGADGKKAESQMKGRRGGGDCKCEVCLGEGMVVRPPGGEEGSGRREP